MGSREKDRLHLVVRLPGTKGTRGEVREEGLKEQPRAVKSALQFLHPGPAGFHDRIQVLGRHGVAKLVQIQA